MSLISLVMFSSIFNSSNPCLKVLGEIISSISNGKKSDLESKKEEPIFLPYS